MHIIDLSGQKFGRWTVVSRAANTPQGQAQWLCRCECGAEKTLKSIVIRRGLSQSCGCRKLEMVIKRSTKHGHSNSARISPTYHSWNGMLARCTNPRHRSYPRYGGSGVTVCERWRTFANFLADMGEKPPGMSIDRIDGAKGYAPDNCRWANAKQQSRNRHSYNVLLTHGGETRCLSEWAEMLGIKRATLEDRLKNGWTTEKALSTPKLW